MHIEHITRDGERWDQIAQQYYGDPLRYAPLIAANPGLAIEPILPSGVRLIVPLLEPSTTNTENLPPWMR